MPVGVSWLLCITTHKYSRSATTKQIFLLLLSTVFSYELDQDYVLICYDVTIDKSFSLSWQYEYFNAVLINEMDEEGKSVELGGEFILQPNEHFNNLSVNLSLSVVQVPTNMYNKGMISVAYTGHVSHSKMTYNKIMCLML